MLTHKLKSTADEYDRLLSDLFQNSFSAQKNERLASSISDAEFFSGAAELDLRKQESFKNWGNILSINSRTGEKPDSGYLKERKDVYELEEYFDQNLAPRMKLKFESRINSSALYSMALEVLSNMFHCSIAFQHQSAFHTRLAQILSRGGLPCGWRGEYPEGDIVVLPLTTKIITSEQASG